MDYKRIPNILVGIKGVKQFILSKPMVYFLVHREAVVYIGSTIRGESRLQAHAYDKYRKWDFDSIFVVEFEDEVSMSIFENEMIAKMMPPMNRVGIKIKPYVRGTKKQ